MKTLIVDDEPRARSLLLNILQNNCDGVDTILTAENLKDGVEIIKAEQPQLVFLDIEMPNQPGIEIFSYLESDEINFELVFTTAYSEYALKAFEMNAIDYILKPIRPQKIVEVVARVQKTFDQMAIQTKLEELRRSLVENNFNKIGVPVADGIKFIHLDHIIRLEADGMYTKVYTKQDGVEIISKPLKFFNHLLDGGHSFYRSHRSHIFNLKYLKQFVRKDGNYVILENDHVIPISKDKKDEFIQLVSKL